LEKAVQSVVPQLASDCEILIVDNASTDNTPQLVAGFAAADPRITVHTEPKLGLSVARNAALTRARGEYVIFLDDDAVAEPDWLTAYRQFLATPTANQIAVVGGVVICDYEKPPPKWYAAAAIGLDLGIKARRLPDSGGLWGCNIAYRRDAAIQVGKFDDRFGHKGATVSAHEESDLNDRLQKAGYEIWWQPCARIKHSVSAERLRFKWQLRNQFSQGRSSALLRLRRMTRGRDRWLFAVGRFLAAPFHCAVNVMLALGSFPFQNGRVAAHALMRCARILGYATQLAVEALYLFAVR